MNAASCQKKNKHKKRRKHKTQTSEAPPMQLKRSWKKHQKPSAHNPHHIKLNKKSGKQTNPSQCQNKQQGINPPIKTPPQSTQTSCDDHRACLKITQQISVTCKQLCCGPNTGDTKITTTTQKSAKYRNPKDTIYKTQ